MCITFFTLNPPSTINPSPYKFIQVFNREEDFDRPTNHLAFWDEDKNILAGRDKRFGGTWLAINIKTGNFAFLTNIDRQHLPVYDKKSAPLGRGKVIWDFCKSDFFEIRSSLYDKDSVNTTINTYLNEIEEDKHRYGGFNLVAGNLKTMQFRHIGNDKFNQGTVDVKDGAYVMTNNAFAQGYKPAQNTLKKFGEIAHNCMINKTKGDEFVEKLQVIAEEGFKFPYTWFEDFSFEKGKELELRKTAIWATKATTFILFDSQNNLKVVEVTYDENLEITGKVLHEAHIEQDL